jgi:hypothetical protein
VPVVQEELPPEVRMVEKVPEAPVPLTVALATATVVPAGFETLMNTAVPETLPEAAVVVPETVYVVVTAPGETETVTASVAAAAASGERKRNAMSIPDAIAVSGFILVVALDREGRSG